MLSAKKIKKKFNDKSIKFKESKNKEEEEKIAVVMSMQSSESEALSWIENEIGEGMWMCVCAQRGKIYCC